MREGLSRSLLCDFKSSQTFLALVFTSTETECNCIYVVLCTGTDTHSV